MSAKIIVTLVCDYDGEDVDDYNEARYEALSLVDSCGNDLVSAFKHVTAYRAEVTG